MTAAQSGVDLHPVALAPLEASGVHRPRINLEVSLQQLGFRDRQDFGNRLVDQVEARLSTKGSAILLDNHANGVRIPYELITARGSGGYRGASYQQRTD